MSWLRIDDGFADHPKLVSLGDIRARWTFLELLTYCARHDTGGYFPATIGDVYKRITPAFVERCLLVGLVDEEADGDLRIHNWERYNPPSKDPTGALRQRRWRNAHRNGSVTDEEP